MVEAKTILILLGIAVFLVAGGGSLVRPAFAQAKEDFTTVKGGISQTVKDIRNKTKAGESGESVG